MVFLLFSATALLPLQVPRNSFIFFTFNPLFIILTMKTLVVFVFCCSSMALAGAAEAAPEEGELVLSEAAPVEDELAESPSSNACPGDWTEFDGRCFQYVPKELSWAKAEKNCHSMDAHLASVHSTAEHNEIQKIIIDASQKLKETWIGGSDAHEVGEWFWSDGSHFDYNDWCAGEPSVQEAQRCLQINYTEDKCWDNIECSTERPSVCVKDAEDFRDVFVCVHACVQNI
ncbi:ladderlectin-like isoform X3 [Gymnodraco acuticeps]|uniref:Ladderlectin-like isoform X3 n=1 Tax=Gymnodraco acuticeps TaxID=8218 RepID=A0A6P8VRK2_GYMAC|nr:ladderlectin-like isoform X3 [Gymnodraco acuticeps]